MARLLFIDSVNVEEIRKWKRRGICDGITTNQKILLNEKNKDFKELIVLICSLTNVPVSIELTGHESLQKMVREAKIYAKWSRHIVVKVPMTLDGLGLEVLQRLKTLEIKTNATLMVSFEQMILSIGAGADYASIFFNRAKDSGYDPVEIIKRTRAFIDNGNYKTQIITGSIRNIRDVGDAFAAGSDIVTIPPKVLDEMLLEKTTQKTVEEFDAAWEKYKTL